MKYEHSCASGIEYGMIIWYYHSLFIIRTVQLGSITNVSAVNFRRNNEVQLASSKFLLLLSYQMYALYTSTRIFHQHFVIKSTKYFVANVPA